MAVPICQPELVGLCSAAWWGSSCSCSPPPWPLLAHRRRTRPPAGLRAMKMKTTTHLPGASRSAPTCTQRTMTTETRSRRHHPRSPRLRVGGVRPTSDVSTPTSRRNSSVHAAGAMTVRTDHAPRHHAPRHHATRVLRATYHVPRAAPHARTHLALLTKRHEPCSLTYSGALMPTQGLWRKLAGWSHRLLQQ